MPPQYTPISRAEIEQFFREHDREWTPNRSGDELVFDYSLAFGYTLRVATSLRYDGDTSRPSGKDAIRTFAFMDGGHGLVKSMVTKRTQNWRKNLRDRIDEVRQLAEFRIEDEMERNANRTEAAQAEDEVRPTLRFEPVRAEIHNGTYTIKNRQTGEHRTLDIKTVLPDDTRPADHFKNQNSGRRTVSLLTGPDNTSDYTMVGWLEEGGIRMTRRYNDNRPTRAIASLLFNLALHGDDSPFAAQYELLKEGRCLRCNRKLTTSESIETGIGPVCAGR